MDQDSVMYNWIGKDVHGNGIQRQVTSIGKKLKCNKLQPAGKGFFYFLLFNII